MKTVFLIFYISLLSCSQNDSVNPKPILMVEKRIIEDKINITYGKFQDSKNVTQLDTIRCNINLVAKLSLSIDNPEDKDILNFLLTFSESCNSNIEYSEFSNEILFDLLFHYPNKVVTYLSNDKVNSQIILTEFESPINDKYNIDDILKTVEKTDECQMKKKVIEHLRKR